MNASKKNRDRFANLLARLASFYTQRPERLDLDRRASEWFKELRRFDLADVEEAVTLVRGDSPDFFPTLGKLENACIRAVARRKEVEAKAEQIARDKREDAEHEATVASVPADPSARDRWVAAAPTPCARLERKWLAECRAGVKVTPEVAKARLAALWDAFDKQSTAAESRRKEG